MPLWKHQVRAIEQLLRMTWLMFVVSVSLFWFLSFHLKTSRKQKRNAA